jgi:hypothetical protein
MYIVLQKLTTRRQLGKSSLQAQGNISPSM